MTMITTEQTISRQERLLERSYEEIERLLNEISQLRAQIECGQIPETATQCPDINRLTKLINTCLETENRLGKCKEQQAGIAQCGVAFDLGAARASIGSKLDKLRSA